MIKNILLILFVCLLKGCAPEVTNPQEYKFTRYIEDKTDWKQLVMGNVRYETTAEGFVLRGELCPYLQCEENSKLKITFPKYYKVIGTYPDEFIRDLSFGHKFHSPYLPIQGAPFLSLFAVDNEIWEIIPLYGEADLYYQTVEEMGHLDFQRLAEKQAPDWVVKEYVKCNDEFTTESDNESYADDLEYYCVDKSAVGGYIFHNERRFVPKFSDGTIMLYVKKRTEDVFAVQVK